VDFSVQVHLPPPQADLVFLAGSSVVGLGSQGLNKVKKLILDNFCFSEISK
jgi:hypothetical protein